MLIVVPECKEHKSTECMQRYGFGDGCNTPYYWFWGCRRIMEKMQEHGLSKDCKHLEYENQWK